MVVSHEAPGENKVGANHPPKEKYLPDPRNRSVMPLVMAS